MKKMDRQDLHIARVYPASKTIFVRWKFIRQQIKSIWKLNETFKDFTNTLACFFSDIYAIKN
jgi:hypothetical protein